MRPNKLLLDLNKELKISIALGVAVNLYEVWVYRTTREEGVFKSQEYLGVAGVTVEHAAAIVYEAEIKMDEDFALIYADKFHHVKVLGPLDLPDSFRKLNGLVPVKRFPPAKDDLEDPDLTTSRNFYWKPAHLSGQKKLKTPS